MLADATSPEAAGAELVLVPVGSMEQHGPHLPLDTDTVIRIDTVAAVETVLRVDTVRIGPADTQVRVDTLLRVDTLRVPVTETLVLTDTLVRVDTLRMPDGAEHTREIVEYGTMAGTTRRQMLRRFANGFGMVGLAGLNFLVSLGMTSMKIFSVPGTTCGRTRSWKPTSTGDPEASGGVHRWDRCAHL